MNRDRVSTVERFGGHTFDTSACACYVPKLVVNSSCCAWPFHEPGWPDSDLCGRCKSHAGPIAECDRCGAECPEVKETP